MGGVGIGAAALMGAPLFIVIFALSLFFYANNGGIPPENLFAPLEDLLNNEFILPIPLFTIAGFILAESQAPRRILRLARALFGWLPGGVAIVSILILAVFTAFTGASGVTIIALGGLIWPIMAKQGFSDRFSLGLLTSSGSIGLLISPLPIFIYLMIASINDSPLEVDAFFASAAIPCLLMVGFLVLYAGYRGVRVQKEREPFRRGEVLPAIREAWAELGLPVFIGALLLSGKISFEDVAICTFLYLFVVEVLIHRDIPLFQKFPRVVMDAMSLVGAIVLILVAVAALNNFFKDEKVAQDLIAWMQQVIPADDPILFLLALNVFLIIVGCMMDIFSAMVAVLPFIIPLAEQYGINQYHLGVIFLANLEVGYMTPPVGMNLFISALHFKRPVMEVARSVLPFMGLLLISVAVITYVEPLSRWLPQQLGMMEQTSREADRAAGLIDQMIRVGGESAGSSSTSKPVEKHEEGLQESVDKYVDPKKGTPDLRCDDKHPCPKGQICETGICISLDDGDDLE